MLTTKHNNLCRRVQQSVQAAHPSRFLFTEDLFILHANYSCIMFMVCPKQGNGKIEDDANLLDGPTSFFPKICIAQPQPEHIIKSLGEKTLNEPAVISA